MYFFAFLYSFYCHVKLLHVCLRDELLIKTFVIIIIIIIIIIDVQSAFT